MKRLTILESGEVDNINEAVEEIHKCIDKIQKDNSYELFSDTSKLFLENIRAYLIIISKCFEN